MANGGKTQGAEAGASMRREPGLLVRVPRWQPSKKFLAWVEAYSKYRLAKDIRVERKTVYAWLSGKCPPDPDNARSIVLLSRKNPTRAGRLTLDDIYVDPGEP